MKSCFNYDMTYSVVGVFVFLAFLLVLGVGLIIGACIQGGTMSPSIMFPFMLLSPLPIMMAASCSSSDGGMFSSQKSGPAVEFGFFMTGILLTSVFALPCVLFLTSKLQMAETLMAVGGAACVMASIFIYQVIFNSTSDEYE